MRRRNAKQQSDAPGEDSFLDVVANLVGILIILVMVIGAQAQQTWQKSAREEVARQGDLSDSKKTVTSASRSLTKMEQENVELERQVKEELLATEMLSAERDAIQLAVLKVEQEIEKQEKSQSEDDQQLLESQNKAAKLREEIQKVKRKTELAREQPDEKVETLDHYPSPIAKTVFGEEFHFRLNKGRIAYVPMQELIELVKLEMDVKGRSLAANQSTTSTVGPIDGFRMQYQLSASEITQRQDEMVVRQKVAQIDRYSLLPARDDFGQPVAQSLADNTELSDRLDQADPTATTISVWVYPDSYTEFRELKLALAKRGYQVAAWPLPEGRRISGSPNGLLSSAQ